MARIDGQDIVAVFRERHLFKPGETISLAPQPTPCTCSMPRRGSDCNFLPTGGAKSNRNDQPRRKDP
jgi:hypothetical protein